MYALEFEVTLDTGEKLKVRIEGANYDLCAKLQDKLNEVGSIEEL